MGFRDLIKLKDMFYSSTQTFQNIKSPKFKGVGQKNKSYNNIAPTIEIVKTARFVDSKVNNGLVSSLMRIFLHSMP
jgi:hypothetical protein